MATAIRVSRSTVLRALDAWNEWRLRSITQIKTVRQFDERFDNFNESVGEGLGMAV